MATAEYYAKKYKVEVELARAWIDKRPWYCPLCLKEKTAKQLVLDHDHKTGIPRGWLCRICNGKLGKVKDDTEWMRRAIQYLKENPLSQ